MTTGASALTAPTAGGATARAAVTRAAVVTTAVRGRRTRRCGTAYSFVLVGPPRGRWAVGSHSPGSTVPSKRPQGKRQLRPRHPLFAAVSSAEPRRSAIPRAFGDGGLLGIADLLGTARGKGCWGHARAARSAQVESASHVTPR